MRTCTTVWMCHNMPHTRTHHTSPNTQQSQQGARPRASKVPTSQPCAKGLQGCFKGCQEPCSPTGGAGGEHQQQQQQHQPSSVVVTKLGDNMRRESLARPRHNRDKARTNAQGGQTPPQCSEDEEEAAECAACGSIIHIYHRTWHCACLRLSS